MNTQATLLALATKLPETSGLRVACRSGEYYTRYSRGEPHLKCPDCAGLGWTLAPDAGGKKLMEAMQKAGWDCYLFLHLTGHVSCQLYRQDSSRYGGGIGATVREATVRAAAQALGVEVSE